MIWISESLVLALNHLFPVLAMHREQGLAKQSVKDNQCWAYREAERVSAHFGSHWDLVGKRVLSVGCGVGGKLPFYAAEGASMLVGIDTDMFSAQAAHALCLEPDIQLNHGANIRTMVADAAHLPFADRSFDVVVSINTLEHIRNPLAALHECKRILRSDGLLYLIFPPFYSPWASHLQDWIHFPWPHVLFAEETLIRSAARIERKRHVNDKLVPPARIDWQNLTENRLPNLNRLTMKEFRHMVSQVGLHPKLCTLLPWGHSYFEGWGVWCRLVLGILQLIKSIPCVQEFIVTKVVCVLQRVG